ncbi:MAG: hypothetical protein U5R06_04600 [candidate division KSB1 bacterium]|nr:hypothetical protein [candidate division KSB1 bacterium]
MLSIDLIGSMIIGGLVMLMILGFTFWYMNTSRDMILDDSQREMVENIGEIIKTDINRMGFGVDSTTSKVLSVTSNSITFNADLDNIGYVNRVKYFVRNAKNSNPHMVRQVTYQDKTREFSVPIKSFRIIAFDSLSNETTTAAAVQALSVEMHVAEAFFQHVDYSKKAGSGYYYKYFVPGNL